MTMTTTATQIGHLAGSKTYGEVRKSFGWRDRALAKLGDVLDRFFREKGAPLFPWDAPLHQGNCGVVGLCMLLDRPYSDVAPILGRGKRAGRWEGETYAVQHQPAALELGFETKVTEGNLGRLGDLAAATAGKPGRFLARVPGHIVVVWDGLIFDQNYPAGALPNEHFSKNDRVTFRLDLVGPAPEPEAPAEPETPTESEAKPVILDGPAAEIALRKAGYTKRGTFKGKNRRPEWTRKMQSGYFDHWGEFHFRKV